MNSTAIRPEPRDWLKILGESNSELESLLNSRVKAKIADKEFTLDNVCYVDKVDFSLVKGKLNLTDKQLEKLRRLCQLWDIKLRPAEISSHRAFIGPIIVTAKKLMFRLLSVLLKDIFHQQKSFNAAAIDMIAELGTEDNK
ncbi:MAG: hypothetical protein R3A13_12495 [Bdellovibrionota bacterium]